MLHSETVEGYYFVQTKQTSVYYDADTLSDTKLDPEKRFHCSVLLY